MTERKAHAFWDQVLRWVTPPDFKALFEDLRD